MATKEQTKTVRTQSQAAVEGWRKAQGSQAEAEALFARMEGNKPGSALELARRCVALTVGPLDALIDMQGNDELAKESIRRTLSADRAKLRGENSTPLEDLLVERVLISRLQLQTTETTYARKLAPCKSLSLDLATFYEKSIARLEKRHLAAVKALAQVRRLQIPPVVQIGPNVLNVGEKGAAAIPAARIHQDVSTADTTVIEGALAQP